MPTGMPSALWISSAKYTPIAEKLRPPPRFSGVNVFHSTGRAAFFFGSTLVL